MNEACLPGVVEVPHGMAAQDAADVVIACAGQGLLEWPAHGWLFIPQDAWVKEEDDAPISFDADVPVSGVNQYIDFFRDGCSVLRPPM